MKPIISVEGLGKKYTIRHEGQGRYRALREEIFKLPQRLFQRKHQDKEEFWALKDVSFDIMPGDRVGIIGRNGAGKSTLLKLLSRITEPSTGKITLRGRIASLLEVGTGFHPELTGRENIFLNGAILGMSRAEVRRKFDEIVDFAGVEKFLDTPVKRYSSGMYVRLAFAVAAHLEPEILIVDEVLAVGDASFQQKCLDKMEQIGNNGRTVLFVSHNLAAVNNLCNYGMLFEDAQLKKFDNISTTIEAYRSLFEENSAAVRHENRPNIKKVWFENEKQEITNSFVIGSSFSICAEIKGPIENAVIAFSISSSDGSRIGSYSTLYQEKFSTCKIRKRTIYSLKINRCNLLAGNYSLSFFIGDSFENCLDSAIDCGRFTIINSDIFETGMVYSPSHGICFFDVNFSSHTI